MNKEELKEVLEKNDLWLEDNEGGKRADLSDDKLSLANLLGAGLIGAGLIGANLIGAGLIDADLVVAVLSGAVMIGVVLIVTGASLKDE